MNKITEYLVVGFLGSGMLLGLYLGQVELAKTIGVGLIGFLGGVLYKEAQNSEEVTVA